ncbi:hypothetical protein M413DRAFT_32331 [Hebeloma cylindrosporum]|uniref:UbiA prenyltransferase family n=1 Tax=Hebeloma cylindrosporum TaxID=76867 RepID=A0A0C3BG26_HEBCY|nr:hypothetical protein M413DRAFT_32331 [Hebeloma cylindrosporum h7]
MLQGRWGTLLSRAQYHLTTLHLFSRADYLTVIPTASVFFKESQITDSTKKWALAKSTLWAFIHLLQIALSNQSSGHEDKLDKPWRPVPSGRITVEQVRRLRWILSAGCLAVSFAAGPFVLAASLGVTLYTILYDDLLLRGHLIFRNLCIAAGYLASDIGTLTLMKPTRIQRLEAEELRSLVCCALLIFTTFSAHDFPDVGGDKTSGRRTFPIVAPYASRWIVSSMVILWTTMICYSWSLDAISRGFFFGLGVVIGVRFLLFRDALRDRRTLSLYKIWLIIAHMQPAGRRAVI